MALIPCGSNSVLSSTGREGDHFYLPGIVLRQIPRSELIFVRRSTPAVDQSHGTRTPSSF